MTLALWFALGFVFGSVPCGLWIVRAFHGIDIREYGSKNIGTTNVFRTVGGKTALLVLICDAGKGVLAVYVAQLFTGGSLYAMVAAGFGVLLGHNYSMFLGFKGGKGVATGLGLLVFFMPQASGISLIIWLAIVFATRYVSLASITASVCVPCIAYYFGYPMPLVIYAAVSSAFIVLRHSENIVRLMNGTESKIKQGNIKDIKK